MVYVLSFHRFLVSITDVLVSENLILDIGEPTAGAICALATAVGYCVAFSVVANRVLLFCEISQIRMPVKCGDWIFCMHIVHVRLVKAVLHMQLQI